MTRSPEGGPISVGFVGSLGRACFSDLWLRISPGAETCYRTGTRRALLAGVAAGEIDIAVYPGPADAMLDTMLLCDDHLVVALGGNHPLARQAAIDEATLSNQPVLLPIEGEEGDFRRLAQSLVPGLRLVSEAPMPLIVQRLANSNALALIAIGQCDEAGRMIVTRPIERLDTAFPIHLSWSTRVASLALGELQAMLREPISPPPCPCVMEHAGSGHDDTGVGAGDTVLG